ncbi:hypothetical protein DBV05_g9957 [Lasiodiplodia theobromae]|uniref:Uncharacterized protein n=1 Tax=Lasiodiplodia theobromae TaxID=45133 RepID=A0A5N5D129_9PEZI|nr:hypothetical protein DBV05_g9957 [Lasiodiplodia theobromae]
MAPRSSSTSHTKKSVAGGHNKNSSISSNSSKIALPRKSIPAPLTRLKFIPQRTTTAARQQRPASLAQAGPSRTTSIRMSPSPTKLVPAAGAAAPAAATTTSSNPSAAGPLSPEGAAGLRQLRILNASTVDLPGTAGSPDATAAPTPATTAPAERSPPPSRLPLAIVPPSRKPVPPVRNPARPPPVINQISPMGTTTTFIFPAPPTGPVPPVRPPLPPPSLSTTSSKLPRVRRGISPPSPPPGFAPPHLPPAAYIPAGARRGVSAPIRFLAGSDAGSLLAPPAVNGRGRGRGGMPAPGRGSGHGRGMPPRLPIPNFSRPLWRIRGGAWPQRSSSMPVAPAGPVGVAFSQSLPGRLSALPEAGLVPFQQLGEEKKEEGEEGAAWPLADKPLPPLPKKDN